MLKLTAYDSFQIAHYSFKLPIINGWIEDLIIMLDHCMNGEMQVDKDKVRS